MTLHLPALREWLADVIDPTRALERASAEKDAENLRSRIYHLTVERDRHLRHIHTLIKNSDVIVDVNADLRRENAELTAEINRLVDVDIDEVDEDFYATEAAKIRADVDAWGGEVL